MSVILNKLIALQRRIGHLHRDLHAIIGFQKSSQSLSNSRGFHLASHVRGRFLTSQVPRSLKQRSNGLQTQYYNQSPQARSLHDTGLNLSSTGLTEGGEVVPTPNEQVKPKLGAADEHFDFGFQTPTGLEGWKSHVLNTMLIYPDFINPEEESTIMKEIEPYMSRLHYETSHWDDAISDYRETERSKWNKKNMFTIDRIRAIAFPPHVPQLKLVHVLDLAKKGHIKPHIDSVRFCGNTIAGLSLLSDSVMRLRHDVEKQFYCDVFLPRFSLYVMSGFVRYEFTHEILSEAESKFKGRLVPRDRRISIMCRNEPPPEEAAASGPVFVSFPQSQTS